MFAQQIAAHDSTNSGRIYDDIEEAALTCKPADISVKMIKSCPQVTYTQASLGRYYTTKHMKVSKNKGQIY